MEIKSTLLPGQNGTKQLLKKFGDQLICVRYRYDKARKKSYKTVELIVDERDWIPSKVVSVNKHVHIRIGFGETELREMVKITGGNWDEDKKAWHLSYRKVLEMGLERRIISDDLSF